MREKSPSSFLSVQEKYIVTKYFSPQATDLSFTGKQLSSLGLADLDRKLMSEDGVGLDNSFTFNGAAKNGDC